MRHPGDDKLNTRSDIDQGVQQQGVYASTPLVATIVPLRAMAPQACWPYRATTRVFPRSHVRCAPILDHKQHQLHYHYSGSVI